MAAYPFSELGIGLSQVYINLDNRVNRELTVVLQQLIHGSRIAALGTLHQGEPFVSMVTYAVGKSGHFILHVSRLAAHTQDMLDHPQVSLLITESEASGKMPQALAR